MPKIHVAHAANLAIGKHDAGRIPAFHDTDEERAQFAENLAAHTRQLTIANTMDCMDDRPTTELGDGTTDPNVLRERVVPQWAGGLTLATTKALVAADAAALRDAKNFMNAYLLTNGMLMKYGYVNGGHAGCGAAGKAEESFGLPVSKDIAIPTLPAVININDEFDVDKNFNDMFDRKRRLADSGFFSGWSGDWHENYLMDTVPANFSTLKTADDAVHGHWAKGVYVIKEPGVGFAKNAFYETTDEMSFALTSSTVQKISEQLGVSKEEQARIALGFGTDALDVSDKLLDEGAEAFTQAA